MNENHALCATPEWADHIHREVLGSLLEEINLGDEMLEIGPGPGAATEWLRTRVRRLVAIEVDSGGCRAARCPVRGLECRGADGRCVATRIRRRVLRFCRYVHDAASPADVALQNKVLSEAWRVLRPAGILVGSDSLGTTDLHDFHAGDTYNPIEPASLISRLQTIGFDHVMVSVGYDIRFVARKPDDGETRCAS